MSKRAIEKAYAAYPLDTINRDDIRFNANRVGYQQGYEQAEKDFALTWEDIAMIDAIILDTNNEIAIDSSKKIIGQTFYEEILKRFNELKK